MTFTEPQKAYSKRAAYEEWKRFGPHLQEYLCELGGTAILVFCVVCFVTLFMSPRSPLPLWLPPPALRLLLVGLLLGGVGWLVAISPAGRLSGAHINPAVSVGFWLLGKMHVRDLTGYVTGQMLGGVLGALMGGLAAGAWGRSIHDATLRPTVSRAEAFLLEALTTFALTSAVYAFVSVKRLIRWTPAAGMLMTGVLVGLDGNLSGAGMNPARWFGPAFFLHFWNNCAIYVVGPILGAALAALLRRALPFRFTKPHTGKLFHDPHYRSVFRDDHVPSASPVSPE